MGAMNVNVSDVQGHLKKLIRDAPAVTVERLRDPSAPLEELAAS